MTQKRKDRRVKQWCKTVVEPSPSGPRAECASEINAFTNDLSLGGARLHAKESLEVGTIVRLRIELVRSQEILCVHGRIKWVKKSNTEGVYVMGVEFQHSTAQTIMCLMKDLHGMNV